MQKGHLEILLEDIRGKFDLVFAGHEVLRNEIREMRTELKQDIELVHFKIDILNNKIDSADEKLNNKIDAVAVDLKSHRTDTEAHHGGVYLVKENRRVFLWPTW